jgi:DNA-binding IclR family transcriptional regulator
MANADYRSFADKVLDALESGKGMTWSELCEATGLTLFWVRESLAELVACEMVTEDVFGGGYVYQLTK